MVTELITIPRKEYYNLRLSAEKLRLLERGGVDNWEWYGESLYRDDGKDIDTIEEELYKEILE